MGGAALDRPPQQLNRIVVRRITRQLRDMETGSLLVKELLDDLSGMILRPILNQEERLRTLVEDTPQENDVAGGIELAFDALKKQASAEKFKRV